LVGVGVGVGVGVDVDGGGECVDLVLVGLGSADVRDGAGCRLVDRPLWRRLTCVVFGGDSGCVAVGVARGECGARVAARLAVACGVEVVAPCGSEGPDWGGSVLVLVATTDTLMVSTTAARAISPAFAHQRLETSHRRLACRPRPAIRISSPVSLNHLIQGAEPACRECFARPARRKLPALINTRRMQAGRRIARGVVVALIAGLFATVAWGAPPAGALTRATVMRQAAGYASARGYYAGIAVVDTATGAIVTSGHADRSFISASVVKVLIATRLLLAGRMHDTTESLAYRMITVSDNDATDTLYPQAGGDALEPWIAQHYHVADLGSPPSSSGAWGLTRLIPRGLALLYAKIKRDARVAPWLLNAMHHVRRTSYVGEYEWWGLPSATTHAAVKQGWNLAAGHANVNTTGYVNSDRYAVVICTRGATSTYLGPISRMITQVARLLLPDGHFPAPVPTVTSVSQSAGPVRGGTSLVVRGTAFTGVTGVLFGSYPGRNVAVSWAGRLTVTAPAHPAAWVNIRIVTTHGTSSIVAADRFRFVAPPRVGSVAPATGPPAGGTQLTITGRTFEKVTQVLVGGTPATSLVTTSTTSLEVVTPAHAAGLVNVRIVTAYGTSPIIEADQYLYDDSAAG
jgi:hypothetical protein